MAKRPSTFDPLDDALEMAAGPALVLDPELRVVRATRGTHELLGFEIAAGEPAVRLLCGDSPKRPVAEALAEGRPTQALISRPGSDNDRLIKVRSVPLGAPESRSGWLLLLEDAGPADTPGPILFHGMWTQHPSMKQVFRIIERVAADDATVLVRGETGSGKELVAQALHTLSHRRTGPFRAINCAALPSNLLESELFGHFRGAFTGAHRDTPGHIQLAHKGTLFLDEVAEVPLELQAKLLRVLETRTVLPVGARDPIPVDVRIVAATHRSLRQEVEEGRFRADLMYRLRVIPIFLPPLRERPGDVSLLAERIIEEFNPRTRRRIEQISPAAKEALDRHDWPGNVRELRNVIQYAYAIGDGPILSPSDLPPELDEREAAALPINEPEHKEMISQDPEAQKIIKVLERTAGNRERAAQILGMSRVTLWRRMKLLGIIS